MSYCCCTPQIHCRYCKNNGKSFIDRSISKDIEEKESTMKAHKHSEVIKAWADGETGQLKSVEIVK